jgi:hypothetical protein
MMEATLKLITWIRRAGFMSRMDFGILKVPIGSIKIIDMYLSTSN